MALLFVGGIMNIVWIAGIALLVLVEKVLPGGGWTGRATGARDGGVGRRDAGLGRLRFVRDQRLQTGETAMPIAHVRGVSLNYEILGDSGPFVVLQPGGQAGRVGAAAACVEDRRGRQSRRPL